MSVGACLPRRKLVARVGTKIMDFFEKLGKKLNLEDEEPKVTTAGFEDEGMYEPEEEAYAQNKNTEMEESGLEEATEEDLREALEDANTDNEDFSAEESEDNAVTASLAMAKASSKTKPKIETSAPDDDIEVGRLTIDVYETKDDIFVKSIIAGVNPDNLDIHITSDSVSIRGERSRDDSIQDENYFYQECFWGAFSRSVILPTEIDPDKADATLDNGILTIKLPKLTKTQQKKLKVKKVS